MHHWPGLVERVDNDGRESVIIYLSVEAGSTGDRNESRIVGTCIIRHDGEALLREATGSCQDT